MYGAGHSIISQVTLGYPGTIQCVGVCEATINEKQEEKVLSQEDGTHEIFARSVLFT